MLTRALVTACCVAITLPAFADDTKPFFLRGGPAFATFDASGTVSAAGQAVPGADVSVKNNTGFALEGGYFLTPEISASLTVGIPPKARIIGEGTLSAAGQLGTVHYGPSALDVQYNVPVDGAFRPYIGGGFSYTLVYSKHGSAISNLKVTDGYGPAIQAGFEYKLTHQFSYFFDAKKIWVSVNASGMTQTPQGLVPATARVALNPVILNTGVSWHF